MQKHTRLRQKLIILIRFTSSSLLSLVTPWNSNLSTQFDFTHMFGWDKSSSPPSALNFTLNWGYLLPPLSSQMDPLDCSLFYLFSWYMLLFWNITKVWAVQENLGFLFGFPSQRRASLTFWVRSIWGRNVWCGCFLGTLKLFLVSAVRGRATAQSETWKDYGIFIIWQSVYSVPGFAGW